MPKGTPAKGRLATEAEKTTITADGRIIAVFHGSYTEAQHAFFSSFVQRWERGELPSIDEAIGAAAGSAPDEEVRTAAYAFGLILARSAIVDVFTAVRAEKWQGVNVLMGDEVGVFIELLLAAAACPQGLSRRAVFELLPLIVGRSIQARKGIGELFTRGCERADLANLWNSTNLPFALAAAWCNPSVRLYEHKQSARDAWERFTSGPAVSGQKAPTFEAFLQASRRLGLFPKAGRLGRRPRNTHIIAEET